ncbi:MAG: T9SS type A sorting domain-containing protein [Brumimicrobium sp.]|nr:T9SS type A sorting domain-containing protein [Brumimicrobium sp.]
MKNYVLIILFSLFWGITYSQTKPLGLPQTVPATKSVVDKNTPILITPAPDLAAIAVQDAASDKNGELYRIGVALPVNQDMIQFGQWETLPNGDRKLSAVIKSDGAHALSLEFSNFHLPSGGTIRAFNKGNWHYSKLYTSADNRPDNGFFLPMVYGDEIILEIFEPAKSAGQTVAFLENIFYNYRSTGNPMVNKINESDPCQVNVNCTPEGDFWQDEKAGVARIYIVDGGSAGLCTGSLVNNTAQDCKPLFLTALHCGVNTSAADMNNWVFYFGYEAPGCTNPSSTGTLLDNSIQSCFRISDSNDGGGNSGSDFLLVQIGTSANEATTINTLKSYNAYWNGWDANNTTSSEGVGIHHPSGDIKKISTYTTNLQTTQWGTATGSHWRVTWSATTNGHGVTEGGSSGSPIFRYTGSGSNENSWIMGTLTGGSSFCSTPNNPDQYGKMSYHWASNGTNANEQLQPWLDPVNSGVLVMNGSSDPCSPPAPPVADFTANQTTVFEGDIVNFTDLTTGVPNTWSWTITPGSNTVEWAYVNGTSATDQNPQVQFNVAGTYTVELTASNAQGTDTETKVNYITVNAIVCGDPVASAYTMGFETGEDLSQWVVINANGDSQTWSLYNFSTTPPQGAHGGDIVAGYLYNTTSPANDWIITGCMDLVAGATYTLSYWWTTDANYPEELEVFLGTDQTVAAMTTSIQNPPTLQNNSWTQETTTFTVPANGEYYVGWHCTSLANQYYLAIDDINLSGVIVGISLTNIPPDITIECDASTNPSNTGQLTATTGCPSGGLTVNYTDNITAGSCANAYTITRTWTVTDNCGNTESHVQTITVQDNTAPVVNCGVTSDVINTFGGSATLPDYIAGSTISDNCSSNANLTITQSPAAGTSLGAGNYTVTITTEDECGNIGSCSISVTVQNNELITITNTPNDIIIECDQSTDPSNTGSLTATTSCGTGGLNISYTDNITSGSCVNAYTVARTWTATDNCGNTETHVQTISVQDNTAPTVVCGQSTDQLNTTTGSVPAPDYTTGATFGDNCTSNANLIITQNPAAGTSLTPGTHTVTISAEDECGNTGNCQIQVTVVNDNGITITNAPANTTIECDESTNPSNTGQLTATTVCASGGLTITYNDVSNGNTCPEIITRTWTVTDNCGNSETHVQTITIDDSTAPSANPLNPLTFQCSADVPAPNTALITGVSDNCTANPSVYFMSDLSDGQTCPETIVRTYGVEDDCGNVTQIVQTIVIDDVTAPTATAPSGISVECNSNIPGPNTAVVTNVADNCSSTPTVSFVSDVSDGMTCPETVTRTYHVTDDCGNILVIEQIITVQDNTSPNASNPATVNVQCIGDVPAANSNAVTDAADNCGIPTVTHLSDVSDGNTCPETITRTYRVTDICGNFIDVTQFIVVNDDILPQVTCASTSDTVQASSGNQMPDYMISATVTDNCTTSPSISQSPLPGTALSLGSNLVTLTVTDDCGNQNTCTIDVIYEDDAGITEHTDWMVNVYPNPAKDILVVDYGQPMSEMTVKLYDANGRLVAEYVSKNENKTVIDVSEIAKGIYTLVLQNENGLMTRKVNKM